MEPRLLQFSNPWLLLGLTAAAAPLLLHLMMRRRARRVRFPAIQLLWPALEQGRRANRLRNISLLVVRTLLLAAAALLLAGPRCESADPRAAGPSATVVVIDDSASMQMRGERFPVLLDAARAMAERELSRSAADPQDVATVIYAGGDENGAEWRTIEDACRVLRKPLTQRSHARPLGAALRKAAELLRGSPQPSKRMLLATDCTPWAFSDVSPSLRIGESRPIVRLLDPVGDEARGNIALRALRSPVGRAPANAAWTIAAELEAQDADVEVWLSGRLDDMPLPRLGPIALARGARVTTSVPAPPVDIGPHLLMLRIEPRDRLDVDQVRWLAFEAAPRPIVWVICRSSADAEDDLTLLILRNLLAPSVMPEAEHLVRVRLVSEAELPGIDASEAPALVIVPTDLGEDGAASPRVLALADAGATLLLVPRGDTEAADWPGLRPLLASTPPAVRKSAVPEQIVLDAEAVPTSADWQEIAVRRWLAVSDLNRDVRVAGRYGSGAPAIVLAERGRGRLVLLTTSPDPLWSELGIDAGPLLVWLHALISAALGPPGSAAEFVVGDVAEHRFASIGPRGVLRVVPAEGSGPPISVDTSDIAAAPRWPTEQPGGFRVVEGDRTAAVYAVNLPADETDYQRLPVEAIEARLGVSDLQVERAPTGEAHASASGPDGWASPRNVAGAALLALLLAEAWLARPSRQSAETKSPASAG